MFKSSNIYMFMLLACLRISWLTGKKEEMYQIQNQKFQNKHALKLNVRKK